MQSSMRSISGIISCRRSVRSPLFKWIKQHLTTKRFYGTSENAARIQICIAIWVYVLVAIMKKRLNVDFSHYTILQVLSITLFEKIPIFLAFTAFDYENIAAEKDNLLKLFDSY